MIFNFHAYASLVHKLTYRRTNHNNMHERGYMERGSINTPLELAILNQIDRFNLAIDLIDRVPRLQGVGGHVKDWLKNQIVEHVRLSGSTPSSRPSAAAVCAAERRLRPTVPDACPSPSRAMVHPGGPCWASQDGGALWPIFAPTLILLHDAAVRRSSERMIFNRREATAAVPDLESCSSRRRPGENAVSIRD